MPLGALTEAELANYYMRGVEFTRPSIAYLALWTAAPTIDGVGGTEVAASGYSRVALPLNTTTWAAWSSGVGGVTNLITVNTPTLAAASGTIVRASLMREATGTGLISLSDAMSYVIAAGNYGTFAPGTLIFKLRS